MRILFSMILLAVLLVSCSPDASLNFDSPVNSSSIGLTSNVSPQILLKSVEFNLTPDGFIDCGQEYEWLDYNNESRNCFYNSYIYCRKARFASFKSTIEGGLLFYNLSVNGPWGFPGSSYNDSCEIQVHHVSDDSYGFTGTIDRYCHELLKRPSTVLA